MKSIVWFAEVGKDDIGLVGGKGANLGEMARNDFPVPPGFIVTAGAYFDYLKHTKLDKKIARYLNKIDPEDSKRLNAISKEIQEDICRHPLPKEVALSIRAAYKKMDDGKDLPFVAVRSSATAEDLPDASFAGQQATFLNMHGEDSVVKAVLKCWASLFEPRAIYYRTINNFDHLKVGIAVPVQKMVESDKSGILFGADPVANDLSKVVIDAGWGLGEAIVSGSVDPDHYIVSKDPLKIITKEINKQDWKIVRASKGGDKHISVPKDEQKAQKLTDEEILILAGLAVKLEAHYGKPMDSEFAIEDGKVYLVQSRPITTLKDKTTDSASQPSVSSTPLPALDAQHPTPNTLLPTPDSEILLHGAAASLGLASGPVKIIHKPTEIDKVLQGDVLVTEMTNPEFVPAMRRSAAIVTDTGGRTSHASIVSRELGIPCVVGTGKATSVLKIGQIITVDGAQGLVYKGKVERPASASSPTTPNPQLPTPNQEAPITGTKVYVNLGEPDQAAKVAAMPVDGVGLLRAEFIIAGIGEHPRAMVKAGRGQEYVDKLSQGIKTICQAFNPRPVVYRATDFKTNEYRDLKGGAEYEPQEANPMIGYRGALRYIKEPDLFKLELEAIKKVRDGYDLKNLWLMIPFVRTLDEFETIRQIVTDTGLRQNNDFKLWIMCEVPSTVILMEKFCQAGIDGVSIGSNDLTQLTLGSDRDNPALAEEFDERDEAVSICIKHVISTCRKHHISVSICGQAPSVYPEVTEMMVKAGTTSVSVTPDMILPSRKLIASVERRLMLNQIIGQ